MRTFGSTATAPYRDRPQCRPLASPRSIKPFAPSHYQQAVFDELTNGSGDIQVVAVAGSGKTKTLEEATNRLPFAMRRRVLMTAFNSHIKQELAIRQQRGDIPQDVTISTIHGLGYGALRQFFRPTDTRNWVDGGKTNRLVEIYWTERLGEPPALWDDDTRDALRSAQQMVRLAMLTLTDPRDQAALLAMADHYGVDIPANYEELILATVPCALRWTAEGLPFRDSEGLTWHPKERISYDDMVYLPVALNLPMRQFDLVFVDEAQDLNRCQQELLMKVRGKRAVWVGDPNQAIYGWSGADSESFDRIQSLTGAKRMPLSICYRCARTVVERAQEIVPEIEAADDAPEGVVLQVTEDELVELAYSHYQDNTREPFLLLCRVNAPLVSIAFELIGRGVPARVKGRDIGEQLIKTMDQLAKLDGFCFEKLPKFADQYLGIQTNVLARRENTEMQIAALQDRVNSIVAVYQAVVTQGITDLAGMRSYVGALFSDESGGVVLSSIHKAKGLEAKRVGILRSSILPHPMAKQDWQRVQEDNLAYVAVTRAREELYIAP